MTNWKIIVDQQQLDKSSKKPLMANWESRYRQDSKFLYTTLILFCYSMILSRHTHNMLKILAKIARSCRDTQGKWWNRHLLSNHYQVSRSKSSGGLSKVRIHMLLMSTISNTFLVLIFLIQHLERTIIICINWLPWFKSPLLRSLMELHCWQSIRMQPFCHPHFTPTLRIYHFWTWLAVILNFHSQLLPHSQLRLSPTACLMPYVSRSIRYRLTSFKLNLLLTSKVS